MRPGIEDIRSISNYTDIYRWNLTFASFPLTGTVGATTAFNAFPSSENLNLRCESVAIPNQTNEKITVNIRGQKVHQSGQATYSGSIQLTFVDTVDNVVQDFIRTWRELVWQTRTGVSQPKLSQEATIILQQLNSLDEPIWQYTLYGCFPQGFDNGSMTNASDIRKPTMTLSYDYYEDGSLLGK